MPDEEGFLDRWSRRKLARQQGDAVPEEATPPAEATADELPAEETAEGEPPPRHPAEDIDIDSLEPGADFGVFMQKGVPAALKRKALRKLWTTNPVFYDRETLTDMFDIADTKTWGIGPTRATSWQIGRGFLSEDEVVRPTRPDAEPEPEEASEEAIAEAPAEEPMAEEAEAEEAEAAAPRVEDDGPATDTVEAEDPVKDEDRGKG